MFPLSMLSLYYTLFSEHIGHVLLNWQKQFLDFEMVTFSCRVMEFKAFLPSKLAFFQFAVLCVRYRYGMGA